MPGLLYGGVASPVLAPAPTPIATSFGFLPSPDRACSRPATTAKGASCRPLFPSATQPDYVAPERLAAVPERPTHRLEFFPELSVNPLERWDEAAQLKSAPPATWDSSDPFLYPRLTKNERYVGISVLDILLFSHGRTEIA
jgi:hypothetical protein